MIHFFWKSLPTSEWVKLLAVPLVLSIGGSIITSKFQEENRQNETINKYFDQMEKLFLNQKLNVSEQNNPVRLLIKSRSLAVLRNIDLKRKAVIISFLAESGLLDSRDSRGHKKNNSDKQGVNLSYFNLTESHFDLTKIADKFKGIKGINLSGLNLRGTNLKNTNLERGNLEGAILEEADLTRANLTKANLTGANLTGVTLTEADLTGANLYNAWLQEAHLYKANLTGAKLVEGAYLANANLKEANLEGANLKEGHFTEANFEKVNLKVADLRGANLTGANLIETNLEGANLEGAGLINIKNITNSQIKSTCFWEKAIYYGYYRGGLHVYEEANQKYIEELKQDKSSDPKRKPNCSRWK